jgi:hypothetical protein
MRRLGEYWEGLRLASDDTLYPGRNKRRGRQCSRIWHEGPQLEGNRSDRGLRGCAALPGATRAIMRSQETWIAACR